MQEALCCFFDIFFDLVVLVSGVQNMRMGKYDCYLIEELLVWSYVLWVVDLDFVCVVMEWLLDCW